MPPELTNLFHRLRHRIRCVLGWQLLGRGMAALAAGFWLGLLLDWYWEPPPAARLTAIIIAVIVVAVWLVRTGVVPLLVKLPSRQLALLAEKREPRFADALISAVDLAQRPPAACEPALLAATTQRAIQQLQRDGDPRLIDSSRAWRWMTVAVLAMMSVAGFMLLNREAMAVYARRLALSAEPWPRAVVLSIDEFTRDDDGVWRRKLAIGDSLDLTVRADLANGHRAPSQVWLRGRFANGERFRDAFSRVGDPVAGEQPHQVYQYRLTDIRSPAQLHLWGGDARLGPLQIVVVPRPVVTRAEIEVAAPAYLGRRAARFPAIAAPATPAGSRVVVHLTSSKPLAEVQAQWSSADRPADAVQFSPGDHKCQITLENAQSDDSLLVTLIDTDGIASAEPHRVVLSVLPDNLPNVTLTLADVGLAITPDAAITARVAVRDDHAIRTATVQVTLDGEPAEPLSLDDQLAGATQAEAAAELDLLQTRFAGGGNAGRLTPGQKLSLVAVAEDACDRGSESRQSASQQLTLEIVTPDQLLAMLEQREVNLRRTFEQTLDEMLRVDHLLATPSESNAANSGESNREDNEAVANAVDEKLLRSRLVESLQKIEQQTLAVANAFDRIRGELIANRIANDELLERIGTGIADRLFELANTDLPELRQRIQTPELPPRQQQSSSAKVVRNMRSILDRMRSLESYNEVLALLRQVIDDQQRLQQATEQSRREQVRRLLLD